MNTGNCFSCATVSGAFLPPGGIAFENQKWIVALRANPVYFPCLPLIILKRHCEDVASLQPEESSTLGSVMQMTALALNQILQPAKVHFGIYAEQVKHLHVHVLPRMPNMPVGNIQNMWLGQWMDLLHTFGLKKSFSNEVVAQYAERLRTAYLNFAIQE